MGPALRREVVQAVVGVREVQDRILQGLWFVHHRPIIGQIVRCVKLIIAIIGTTATRHRGSDQGRCGPGPDLSYPRGLVRGGAASAGGRVGQGGCYHGRGCGAAAGSGAGRCARTAGDCGHGGQPDVFAHERHRILDVQGVLQL